MVEKGESSKWSSVLKGTKHFLGIDQTDTNALSTDTSNSLKRSPIYQNKALTNWNERTFRVLKSNAVFGGKIKQTALDQYINTIDDSSTSDANTFLYFKSRGQQSLDLPKQTGLTDIAIDGIRKTFKVGFFVLFSILAFRVF